MTSARHGDLAVVGADTSNARVLRVTTFPAASHVDPPNVTHSSEFVPTRLGRSDPPVETHYYSVHCSPHTFPTTDGSPVTIRIQQQNPTTTKIQFVLPDEIHEGPVSAVGSFNDWQPGTHRLVRRSNGTRSVTVSVPRGQEVRFRYLGDGGIWFDDPDAHEITQEGSLVRT